MVAAAAVASFEAATSKAVVSRRSRLVRRGRCPSALTAAGGAGVGGAPDSCWNEGRIDRDDADLVVMVDRTFRMIISPSPCPPCHHLTCVAPIPPDHKMLLTTKRHHPNYSKNFAFLSGTIICDLDLLARAAEHGAGYAGYCVRDLAQLDSLDTMAQPSETLEAQTDEQLQTVARPPLLSPTPASTLP